MTSYEQAGRLFQFFNLRQSRQDLCSLCWSSLEAVNSVYVVFWA